jgi:hypothetical protein
MTDQPTDNVSSPQDGAVDKPAVMRRLAVALVFTKVVGNVVNNTLWMERIDATSAEEALGIGIQKARGRGEGWCNDPISMHHVLDFGAA